MKLHIVALSVAIALTAYVMPTTVHAQFDPSGDGSGDYVDPGAVDNGGGFGGGGGAGGVQGGRGGRGGRGGAQGGQAGQGGQGGQAGGRGGRNNNNGNGNGGAAGGLAGGPGGFGGTNGGPGGFGGQNGQTGGRGGRGAGGVGGTAGGVQGAISSPDDEWAVIAPRVQKVSDEKNLVAGNNPRTAGGAGGFGGGGGGGRGGRGGGAGGFGGGAAAAPTAAAVAAPNPVLLAMNDLYNALNDPASSDDVIRTKLRTLRDAKAKAENDLKSAQDDLRNVVTLRQEAILMDLGYLE